MKKLLVLALAFMMLLSVIACSNPTTSDPTPDPGQTNTEATPAPTDAQGAEETWGVRFRQNPRPSTPTLRPMTRPSSARKRSLSLCSSMKTAN